MAEHTTEILARELRKAGLEQMAFNAERGLYHDYLSPLPTPCLTLAEHLKKAGTPAANEILKRHLNGEFDATKEESDDWAKSADGKDALSHLSPEMQAVLGFKP